MKRTSRKWVFLATFWSSSPIQSFTFQTNTGNRVHVSSFSCNPPCPRISIRTFLKDDDSDDRDEGKDPRSLDEFLDQPFFDPDQYQDDDRSVLGRLASFIKRDYELAETIYAGLIFVVLVIVSQELLRIQLYGDQYVPFKSISGLARNGKLF